MAQKLIQTEEQRQSQVQRLTQQQVMLVKMLEMPLAELEQRISAEIDDNPALEPLSPNENDNADGLNTPADADTDNYDSADTDDFAPTTGADDSVLADMDDDMPQPTLTGADRQNADFEEMTYGDTQSFYDKLKAQMGEEELTPEQQEIMEYLIGSLDNDGLLRKDVSDIADELALYQNIYASEKEIMEVLDVLKTFDPPGIGATSLQECLLLQIARKPESALKAKMAEVIEQCFDDFMNKRWNRVREHLETDQEELQLVIGELLRLNPKPGASMGEAEGRSQQQITPDFIIDTADDGTVTFTINEGEIPQLCISPSFTDMLQRYKKEKSQMSRSDREAAIYIKEKVERAQAFIDSIRQRRETLYVTMKAIIDIQRRYFQDGDEADLQPMILKDVADRTGLDISTISRVSNMKYAETAWGVFPLRHFFSDRMKTDSGEELSTRRIKSVLKELIAAEDKSAPLNDSDLRRELEKQGLPVARRTVAKYREQLGIPTARLRRE